MSEPPIPGVAESLPVESFRAAAQHLRRPFTAQAVKFKVQTAFPKNDPNAALIVAYIDARLAVERLNHVCPDLWWEEFESLDGGLMLCRLTVDGITRRDVGQGYQGKGLYSDALKRAAVKFGVGVSLYAIPKIILKTADGHIKQKKVREGMTLVLTPAGEERCRVIYEMWLDTKGRQAFGDVLDHGDAEGAVGDAEGDQAVVGAEAEEVPTLSAEKVEQLVKGIEVVKPALAENAVNALDGLNVLLGSLGIDAIDPATPLRDQLARWTPEQADALDAELQRMVGDGD